MHIHIEKTLGFGPEQVYAFYYPSQARRIAGLGIEQPHPIKIGRAKDGLKRVRELSAGSPEVPVIALILRCEDSFLVERALHARLQGSRLKDEWFQTTPDEIEWNWMDLDSPRSTLGEQLRHFRSRAGLTQQELADASGVRQATISRIESGRSVGRLDTLQTIARELGVQVSLTLPEFA